MDTSPEDKYIFLIISGSFFFRTWNITEKSSKENQNTNFTFSMKFVPFMR